MTIRKRYDRAVGEFISEASAGPPEDTLTRDEVLDLFLKFRETVALSRLRKIQASTPFSRPCYDKSSRCPGWAGGAWIRARVSRCENGSLGRTSFRRRYWLGARCPECGLYVLPIVTRWLDPAWIWWAIRHPGHWSNWAWRIRPARLRRLWRKR